MNTLQIKTKEVLTRGKNDKIELRMTVETLLGQDENAEHLKELLLTVKSQAVLLNFKDLKIEMHAVMKKASVSYRKDEGIKLQIPFYVPSWVGEETNAEKLKKLVLSVNDEEHTLLLAETQPDMFDENKEEESE